MTDEQAKAIAIYHAKAPVNREGAQRTADRSLRLFKHLLADEEWSDSRCGLGHVLGLGGGVRNRAEFDEEMGKVRDRLTPGWRRTGRSGK